MSSDDDDGVPVGGGRSRRASLANHGRSRARTLDDSSSDEELFADNTKATEEDEEDLAYSADRMKAAVVRTGLQCAYIFCHTIHFCLTHSIIDRARRLFSSPA
jgi:hypothetical protein